ncbi:flavoprotein [Kitasatospora sp. NPDC059795]|uniref:flavoprotein n=1 Tax=Kitasatospora sp. NPDC059795 TaxID=3346949 RepID=UPI00364D071C
MSTAPPIPAAAAPPGTPDPGDGAAVPRRLLIGVSGSISVLALPGYLNAFRLAGVERITLVATRTAERFLPADTLRLICDAVCTEDAHGPGHVALGRWADAVLVLPATANVLGCFATGTAPTLLTSTLLCAEQPVVLAPVMNPVMWRTPQVARNVDRLRADGHQVVDPVPGLAYEVASRTMRPALTLPSAEQLLAACRTGTEAEAEVTG